MEGQARTACRKPVPAGRAMKKSVIAAIALGLSATLVPATAQTMPNPIPIPQQADAQPVSAYIGHPAAPRPIDALPVPENPFMSPGAWSNMHSDTYMSDTYSTPAALGRRPLVASTFLGSAKAPLGLVIGMTFDPTGIIVAGAVRVTALPSGTAYVQLTLIEPGTLKTLATLDLPGQPMVVGGGFRPAGTYFYQDQSGDILAGTPERTIWRVSHTASSFTKEGVYDLTAVIPQQDEIMALQPDFSGRLWFTSKGGVVGTLDLDTGKVLGTYHLPDGERIVNSHATDATGGAFIVSTAAMYRFDADPSGAPDVSWRAEYDQGDRVKPGQVDIGSGTTPTLMGRKYVAITDNADPRMNVLVLRRAKKVTGPRVTCQVPVFEPWKGSNENSLVATERSIVVENNYGYKDITTTSGGNTTTPGLARIDVGADGVCTEAWTNNSVSIPTVVTKLSLATGLIYTYTKPQGPGDTDRWYFTAISFRTGKVVYSRLAGTGTLYNNHYAPLYLGPDGTVYAGVLGGLVAMRDGVPRRSTR